MELDRQNQKQFKLDEYEKICPSCKGQKKFVTEKGYINCRRCNGSGRIDWISEIKQIKCEVCKDTGIVGSHQGFTDISIRGYKVSVPIGPIYFEECPYCEK